MTAARSVSRKQVRRLRASRALFHALFVIGGLLSIAIIWSAISAASLGDGQWLFADFGDVRIYGERGSWWPLGKIPYLEVFSEYPQVATWTFAIPHMIAGWLRSVCGVTFRYSAIFGVMMALFAAGSILLIHRLRPDRKAWSYLLLLPASLYFTFNRFDIMPCFFGLLALYALSRKRWVAAGAILAIGVLTKWYLVLWVPIFGLYFWHARGHRIPWSMGMAFGATVVFLLLFTLCSGGLAALLVPYTFHLSRWSNAETLLSLLNLFSIGAFGIDFEGRKVLQVFFLLQFIAFPLCLTSRIDTFEKVVKWAAFSTLCFVSFTKFYSPQWILWIAPVLILSARRARDLIGLIALDLVTYWYFPVLFFTAGWYSPIFTVAILVKTGILLFLVASLGRELLQDNLLVPQIQRWAEGARRALSA